MRAMPTIASLLIAPADVYALIAGGKFVLAGGFLVWGAHFTRTRVRQRQRNDAHQQPDL